MNESENWDEARKSVLEILTEILLKIEWHYGDNRAPFRFPPTFKATARPDGSTIYQCVIETDLGEPEEQIILSAGSPESLPDIVRMSISERFFPPME